MSLNSRDELIDSMGNNSSRIVLDKATIASQAAGTFVSLWRATGQPGQGATPTTAAVCDNSLTGAINFTQQTAPATSYGTYLDCATGNAAMTVELHDRLMHMGGLSGTVTTAQTVNLDVDANLATSNLSARKGDTNYSDIQWWAEWYTATGGTGVNLTVNVTYNDGSTGNLTAVALAATRPASFMLPLNSLIPAADSGKYIRDINNATLSATTGTAGNFGFTATRPRMTITTPIANFKSVANWADLGLPEIFNSTCLFPLVLTSTTSSGTVRGGGKISHG